ncbi:hypothetical protein [Nisaea sp.]|uniref:hypothetical protein n=1 Tax=Nisaea sp. TaxID=2024842 RepID=UPI003B52B266
MTESINQIDVLRGYLKKSFDSTGVKVKDLTINNLLNELTGVRSDIQIKPFRIRAKYDEDGRAENIQILIAGSQEFVSSKLDQVTHKGGVDVDFKVDGEFVLLDLTSGQNNNWNMQTSISAGLSTDSTFISRNVVQFQTEDRYKVTAVYKDLSLEHNLLTEEPSAIVGRYESNYKFKVGGQLVDSDTFVAEHDFSKLFDLQNNSDFYENSLN